MLGHNQQEFGESRLAGAHVRPAWSRCCSMATTSNLRTLPPGTGQAMDLRYDGYAVANFCEIAPADRPRQVIGNGEDRY
jgi:hypothetical protein